MKFALPHVLISVHWYLQHKNVLLPFSPTLCVSEGFSITDGPQLGQPHCLIRSSLNYLGKHKSDFFSQLSMD